jgi:pimeloyl-ACP methyl ester carboxylesterase
MSNADQSDCSVYEQGLCGWLRLHRLTRRVLSTLAVKLHSGFAVGLRPVQPLRMSFVRRRPSVSARHLVVFLPGIGDLMEDYELNGFLSIARERGLTADMVLVDAHYGYYANRSILERLRHDVVQPARDSRYELISLVGNSLGGLGALLYAVRYPSHIDRVVALAPYLGQPQLITEIAQAGGLSTWMPMFPSTCGDHERELRRLWQWLQAWSCQRPGAPSIHLGYGERDCFRAGHQLLAEALPPGHVVRTPGGHDWRTWRRLWDPLLRALL